MKFNHDKLRELREAQKPKAITQAEFARKIGASRQLVALWECGDTQPQLGTLLKICTKFRKPLTYFVEKE